MLLCGIIKDNEEIKLENGEQIIEYIKNYIEKDDELKELYTKYAGGQLMVSEFNYAEFAVRILGWTIIDEAKVYYQKGVNNFDKVEYIKTGMKMQKMEKFIYNGRRFIPYQSPAEREMQLIGSKIVNSPENELSFWYPKSANIGFTTPDTLITPLTKEELAIVKSAQFEKFDYLAFLKRLRENAINNNFSLDRELFLRFGCSSNKFNFNACHIPTLEFLPERLNDFFNNIYEKLEWRESAEVVLREFIKTSYYRRQIYNGMPLNSEFRVFYDFDTNQILGIYNYWDTEGMLDNLYKQDDAMAFAHTIPLLESDFTRLSPQLEKEVEAKLPNAKMQGRWSVDFMFDGSNFVLIDMGRAECSAFYERVLEKELKPTNH